MITDEITKCIVIQLNALEGNTSTVSLP